MLDHSLRPHGLFATSAPAAALLVIAQNTTVMAPVASGGRVMCLVWLFWVRAAWCRSWWALVSGSTFAWSGSMVTSFASSTRLRRRWRQIWTRYHVNAVVSRTWKGLLTLAWCVVFATGKRGCDAVLGSAWGTCRRGGVHTGHLGCRFHERSRHSGRVQQCMECAARCTHRSGVCRQCEWMFILFTLCAHCCRLLLLLFAARQDDVQLAASLRPCSSTQPQPHCRTAAHAGVPTAHHPVVWHWCSTRWPAPTGPTVDTVVCCLHGVSWVAMASCVACHHSRGGMHTLLYSFWERTRLRATRWVWRLVATVLLIADVGWLCLLLAWRHWGLAPALSGIGAGVVSGTATALPAWTFLVLHA